MKPLKIILSVFVLLLLYQCSTEKIAHNAFFIAPSGNDSWSGKLAEPNKNETDGPFATFQKAQEAIRELKKTGKLPAAGVTVYVREGNYSISKTIKLTTEDSGEQNALITWRSYPGERVVFSGGKAISGFTKIKDAEILNQIERIYHDSILVCDLQELPKGLTFHPHTPLAMELFFNNEAMTLARYPNEGWLEITDVPQFGTELIYKGNLPHKRFGIMVGRHYGRFTYNSDRPERWHKTEDIWMHGYWSWDWSEKYGRIEKIDTIKKEIYPAAPYSGYGYTKEQRFYFLNVLEELDSPGEYYINRKTGKLYFWPPENINTGEATVSIMEEPLLVLENTSYVNIEGISFECSRTTAIKIIGGNSNKIAACVFRNLGNVAVIIDGGKKNGILSCDIYEIAGGGIQLTGGDRMTLTPANNYAENNHIYNFGRVFRTYSPAISMNGVGNRLSHNHIHDSPHAGVLFGGNEHILEFNEIHDIAKETGDVGAFYIGRNWTSRGNIIRYNYFHHLFGPGLHGVRAVYLDDFSSGTTIFGNVFYQAGRAAFIGGGRDNTIENNIFIECDPSIQVDARGLSWAKNYFDKSDKLHHSTLFDGMDAVNFSQPPYSEKYPELLTLYDDDPAIPKNNKIVRNVSFGGRFIDLYDKLNFEIVEVKDNLIGDPVLLRESLESDQSDNFQTFKYGHVETMENMKGNKFLEDNPGFKNIEKGKFQLNNNSPAYKLGFKKIPIEKIGLYSDDYRKSLNSKNKIPADTESITIANIAVFGGNFWRNQALRDIMPYWLKYSLDTVDGAFITNFDRSWNQIGGTEKHPSMISRHVFGYSVAYLFTGEEKYLKIASDAVDFLLEHAWDEEYGGWYNRLDKQGNPTDSTKNTFVQFYTNTGLSLYYLVTHDKNVLQYIERSNEIAETKRRDTINDGFYNILYRDLSVKDYNKNFSSEVVPVSSYMLYLYLATRNDKYLEQAERIMNIALDKMQCPETNWIIEPFDKDWNYITRNSNLKTEINIGHNQEVVWMFYRLYLLTGKKEYLDSTKAITEKIYKWGVAENGAWYSSCGKKDPSMHTDFSYWWIQVYGNMFDIFNYKLTGDKEYLKQFKKGADFWNKYFIDEKYGDTYRGVFINGEIKDDIKAASDKTSYHAMEYNLLISLYLDLWVNNKPVELYYCIQSPEKNEKFYPSPFEDLSVKIKEVTINGENWTDFNKDKAYIILPELKKIEMKVVLK